MQGGGGSGESIRGSGGGYGGGEAQDERISWLETELFVMSGKVEYV